MTGVLHLNHWVLAGGINVIKVIKSTKGTNVTKVIKLSY